MAEQITQELAEKRVREKCKEKGYASIPFYYKNWKTPIPVYCGKKGHNISYIQYSNFVNSNYRL